MKQILIIGAGKSSAHLIQYLSNESQRLDIGLCIIDRVIDQIPKSILNDRVCISALGDHAENSFEQFIVKSDIVISMLPASMHYNIAELCLKHGKHLITPSYISDSIRGLDEAAKAKKLIFLNEMGFDPGIDHMTTMKIADEIKDQGGTIKSYRSYAGGLVASKSDTNPWNYKFSWNPRNVILAGQGGEILFRRNHASQIIHYEELFEKSEEIKLNDRLTFDGYANRDSLKYEGIYGWENLETILRGTLRRSGFCKAWDFLIQLGLTSDSKLISLKENASLADYYSEFHKIKVDQNLRSTFINHYNLEGNADLLTKLDFIGFFDTTTTLGKTEGSPALILQSILEEKWRLQTGDTDYVVMIHFIEYELNGRRYEIQSSFDLEGDDDRYTAMSKTVGMPIAYAAEMIILDQIKNYGVQIPTDRDLYMPILKHLEKDGVIFYENTKEF